MVAAYFDGKSNAHGVLSIHGAEHCVPNVQIETVFDLVFSAVPLYWDGVSYVFEDNQFFPKDTSVPPSRVAQFCKRP
jgi:hypothetical protein